MAPSFSTETFIGLYQGVMMDCNLFGVPDCKICFFLVLPLYVLVFCHMITFRLFTAEDIPAILTMMQEFNAIDDYPFNAEERSKNLHSLLVNPGYGKLWMIEHNQQIAGYTFLGFGFSFEFKGRDAFIDELFILPAFQGKGLGKAAVEFVSDQAKLSGVKVLHLEAEKKNERALALYRNNGFKNHNRFLLSKYL